MDVLKVTGYRIRPPHLVGEKKGFFAREGLRIDFELATYAPDHNRGMAEGRWDFTLSSADTMIARATTDRVDYVLFMQAEEGLDACLVGRPEIRSLADLRGKLLAGDPGDSNLDLIRRKILGDNGIAEGEYSVEIIGSSPVRFEAFQAGRVAAAMLTPPWSEKALAGGATLLARASDYVPVWPLTCGWGLRSWLERHRGLVVRFLRAWVAATDWLLDPANREELFALARSELGMSESAIERALQTVVPKARIDPAAIAAVIDLRKAMGLYPPPHSPPERFYDLSYWLAATRS